MDAIYGQTGGCSLGRNSWLAQVCSWPLAGLYLYRDELVLKIPFRSYCFPRDLLSEIHRYGSGLSVGLKIEHRVIDSPRFVVFFPTDLVEMEEVLDANAFPIATRSA
jgi:hypothetical protein